MNGLAGLAPFVLIALVFWLLLIRPQRRRQQELAATQRGVEVGDEVILGAGIVGRVSESDDEYIRLEVDPGVHLKVARQAVVRVLHPEDATAEDTEELLEDHLDGAPAPGTTPDIETDSRVDPTDHSRDH